MPTTTTDFTPVASADLAAMHRGTLQLREVLQRSRARRFHDLDPVDAERRAFERGRLAAEAGASSANPYGDDRAEEQAMWWDGYASVVQA